MQLTKKEQLCYAFSKKIRSFVVFLNGTLYIFLNGLKYYLIVNAKVYISINTLKMNNKYDRYSTI